jgi:Cu-Zn family superoxide dismutase
MKRLLLAGAACALAAAPISAGADLANTDLVWGAAQLVDTSGRNVGAVTFYTPNGYGTDIRAYVEVKGLPPGAHALHLHQVGRCQQNFASAGEHLSTRNERHGFVNKVAVHTGDLPNLHVPPEGSIATSMRMPKVEWEREVFDRDGTSVVIHQMPDDYRSQPSGDSGDRIACGVVVRNPTGTGLGKAG